MPLLDLLFSYEILNFRHKPTGWEYFLSLIFGQESILYFQRLPRAESTQRALRPVTLLIIKVPVSLCPQTSPQREDAGLPFVRKDHRIYLQPVLYFGPPGKMS